MSATDQLLANNESYASSFSKGDLPLPPGTQGGGGGLHGRASRSGAACSAWRRATRT